MLKSILLFGLVSYSFANSNESTNRMNRSMVESGSITGPNGRDLIGGLIDHLTCARTTNRGFNGRCVPIDCCSRSMGVNELCSNPDYTCCYGGERCTSNNDGFINDNRYPNGDFPINMNGVRRDRCDRNSYVHRREWGAAETLDRIRPLPRRIETVIVHHTDDGDRACWSYDECVRYMRNTQRHYQVRKNFPDIPWNFLIGENGEVFEGMGWGVEGYHTESWNERSIGIAFIGDYDRQSPSRSSIIAFENLIECGVRSGYLDSYYGIYGHRDMRDTDCPGDLLYDTIRHMKAFRQYGNRIYLGRSVNSTLEPNNRTH